MRRTLNSVVNFYDFIYTYTIEKRTDFLCEGAEYSGGAANNLKVTHLSGLTLALTHRL